MPENSGGAEAPANENDQTSGRRNEDRTVVDNAQSRSQTAGKFKGKCEALKGHVFEIVSSGTDSFTKVNEEIAEYVARTIPGAGDFRTAMINMSLDPLVEPVFPADPAAPNHAELLEIWREDRKLFIKRQEERRKVANQVFPIVLGQCDPAMRARIEADINWDDINNACDVIRLLQLIRNCEVQRQTRRDEDHTLIEATKNVYIYNKFIIKALCKTFLKDKTVVACTGSD